MISLDLENVRRRLAFVGLSLGVLLFLASALPGNAKAAATPGVVTVNSTLFSAINVDLQDDLGSPTVTVKGQPAGTKGWPVRAIILYAQNQSGNKFDINNFEKDPRASRSNGAFISVDRNQVKSSRYDANLPVYFIDQNGNTAMREADGTLNTYLNTNPQVSVSKSLISLGVKITSPAGPVKLKVGDKQSFTAKVDNPSGVTVTLKWLVDGVERQSGQTATGGTFSTDFRSEGTFDVSVIATANQAVEVDAVKVTVGKPPKKKPDKKKKKKQDQSGTPEDNSYDPGYVPGYGDPYGGGTGSGPGSAGSAPPSSPDPDKKQQDQPTTDQSGQTVTGELIDPSNITTVAPSTDTPATDSGEQADPADDGSGGGGIPTGVKTAFGIGALLGLGGLAEAGAFTGRIRRLRFWP